VNREENEEREREREREREKQGSSRALWECGMKVSGVEVIETAVIHVIKLQYAIYLDLMKTKNGVRIFCDFNFNDVCMLNTHYYCSLYVKYNGSYIF